MTTKYLDSNGLSYLWGKLKDYFQPKLVSGTNIKTVNNSSILESGNISIPSKVSDLTNDSGFITGYTETDPVFSASDAAGITATQISNWDSAATKFSGGLFKTKQLTPTGWSFSSGQYRKIEITTYNVDISGYFPIIYSANCTSHAALHVFNYGFDNGHVFLEVINRTSTSVTANFSVKLLYIKSSAAVAL